MTWTAGYPLNQGRYSVTKVLGQGGMGITYLAKDLQGHWVVSELPRPQGDGASQLNSNRLYG